MISEIRDMPETKKLVRLALALLLVWTAGALLFAGAYRSLGQSGKNLSSSKKILNAAYTFYSHSQQRSAELGDPLTRLNDILGDLGLKERTEFTNTASSEITARITDMDASELSLFLKGLSEKGFSVRTAEMRAITSEQKGRLINLSIMIGAGSDDSL